MAGRYTNSGENLKREWRIPALNVRYHKDGNRYMPLDEFPGALADENGYVLFHTRKAYEGCSQLQINPKVHVTGGISMIPGYVRVVSSCGDSSGEFTLPDEVPSSGLVEGASRTVTVNAYERSAEARRRCIAYHGTACYICRFRFEARYGEVAEGYIHVHHLTPLSDVGDEYEVDPVEDLRPVCPNCHAVLHLGGRCRSIDEVQQLLR